MSSSRGSSQPQGSPTRLPHPWDPPGKNTRVGCHFLLQEIFLTQESNTGLLHCRWSLYRFVLFSAKQTILNLSPWVGEDPLEEGMAAHSSILAGRIPWTEEPGELQSIGSPSLIRRGGIDPAHQSDGRGMVLALHECTEC